MASYRGAATISAIGVPPTGTHPGLLPRAAGGLARGLRDRHRQAQDQAVRSDHRPADRRHAAAVDGRADPDRSGGDRQAPSAAAGGSPIPRPRRSCSRRPASASSGDSWHTPDGKPFTIRIMVEGEARPVMTRAGIDDRAAVAPVRHRCHDRRRAGHAGRPARRRRLRRRSSAGASRPGAAIPTCRSSSTAGTRSSSPSRASRSRRATGSAGRTPSSTRSSSRSARSASTTRGRRARPGVRQARGARDADHPADVVQRVHGDGRHLLDRLSRARTTPTPIRCRTGRNSKYMLVKLKPAEVAQN